MVGRTRRWIGPILLSFFITACGMKGNRAEEFEIFPDFKTEDLEGNEVTGTIFEEKDITMVNFWGSTCSPCLEELDELSEISKKLPENAAIIGVLMDVPLGYLDGMERAKEAVKEAGVSYKNLLLDEALTSFSDRVSLTPYTIFVDKKGRIVGNTVKGARVEAYIEELESLIEGFQYEE